MWSKYFSSCQRTDNELTVSGCERFIVAGTLIQILYYFSDLKPINLTPHQTISFATHQLLVFRF